MLRFDGQVLTGTALFTRSFTPGTPVSESSTNDISGDPQFCELLPVTAGAAQIVLKDPTGAVLGPIVLGGAAPTVTVSLVKSLAGLRFVRMSLLCKGSILPLDEPAFS